MNLLVVAAIVFIVVVVIIAYFVTSSKKPKAEGFEESPEVLHGVYGALSGTTPVREAFGGGGANGTGSRGKGGVVKIEYFYHPTCPSCIAYSPIFDKAKAVISRDFPNVVIGKFSVAERENHERMKMVTGGTWTTIPCVVLWYSNGGKVYLDETKRNHLVEYVKHTESAW